jgi:hypothetical protein
MLQPYTRHPLHCIAQIWSYAPADFPPILASSEKQEDTLLEKYRPLIQNLTPDMLAALQRAHSSRSIDTSDPDALYKSAELQGFCHADLCAPLLPSDDPTDIATLETLIGCPISRIPRGESYLLRQALHQHIRRSVRQDPRIIVRVMLPNPKQYNSASWHRYNLYRQGMSCDEYYRAGGLAADVKWDSRHGFIRLQGGR